MLDITRAYKNGASAEIDQLKDEIRAVQMGLTRGEEGTEHVRSVLYQALDNIRDQMPYGSDVGNITPNDLERSMETARRAFERINALV